MILCFVLLYHSWFMHVLTRQWNVPRYCVFYCWFGLVWIMVKNTWLIVCAIVIDWSKIQKVLIQTHLLSIAHFTLQINQLKYIHTAQTLQYCFEEKTNSINYCIYHFVIKNRGLARKLHSNHIASTLDFLLDSSQLSRHSIALGSDYVYYA